MTRSVRLIALLAALACTAGSTPPAAPGPADRAQILAAAREVMKQAHYCTLVTIGEGGQPQARIVDPSEPDPNFIIWVATKDGTRKVAQLRKNPGATLLYFDRTTLSYATLLGSATLVSDPAEKERRWQAAWAPFYPEGPKTPGLILIRFSLRTLEIVSLRHKLLNDPQTWRPVTVEFN